jgi:hypothetical protein
MPKTRPLRDIPKISPLLAMRGIGAERAARAVVDAVDMAVLVSMEMMWPSLLGLMRKLAHAPVEADGWRVRKHPSHKPGHCHLVLEEIGGHGGYLLAIKLRQTKTDEALDRLRVLSAAVEDKISSISDSEERHRVRHNAIMRPSADIEAIHAEPSSYLPDSECGDIEHIVCCAYSGEGHAPQGYDVEAQMPFELETVIAVGLEPAAHMPGEIFSFQPSWHLACGYEPEIPLSRSVSSIGTSISVLSRMGGMMEAAGLADEVRSRNTLLGGVSYVHHFPQSRTALLEMGAGTVHRDGGMIGGLTVATILQSWKAACCMTIAKNADAAGSAVRLLKDNGHVREADPYVTYGDRCHVVELDEGQGTLVVATQHNRYEADYVLDEDGMITSVCIGIVGDDGRFPAAGEKGFLGSYRIGAGGTVDADLHEAGFHHGNVMRALHDFTAAVATAAREITQDRTGRLLMAM